MVSPTILSYFDGQSIYFLYKRDEWAKHKDLDQYEAKWLYVEALLKVRILFLARYHKA
jgi:hypothetical protein